MLLISLLSRRRQDDMVFPSPCSVSICVCIFMFKHMYGEMHIAMVSWRSLPPTWHYGGITTIYIATQLILCCPCL